MRKGIHVSAEAVDAAVQALGRGDMKTISQFITGLQQQVDLMNPDPAIDFTAHPMVALSEPYATATV